MRLRAVLNLFGCLVGVGWGSAWSGVSESVGFGFVVGSGSCKSSQNPSRSRWQGASKSIFMTSSEMVWVLLMLEEMGWVTGGRTGVIVAAADRFCAWRRLSWGRKGKLATGVATAGLVPCRFG